ncbi:hypothetical protein [Hathewaya limosa]|uniref:Transmembrane protein n=1 Tax=Hathewaya limosa TaxID=1536 RepID=A0ABU0JQR5_HATLI|nr:hypothetical protein [Hathewaya limosa]MDQ0478389.1 hypothetical protein [Hathewaya limosa]
MKLNKAIKKQKKNFKTFLFLMGFIFMLFPCVVIFGKIYNYYIYIYVGLSDAIVLFAILNRIDEENLIYENKLKKFDIKNGIFESKVSFNCEDVVFVHIEEKMENNIILIIKSKRNNRGLKKIGKSFLKKHPYAATYYYNLYQLKPNYNYYYVIVTNGKYKKYFLLNELYRSCFNAFYSEESISNIKKYREELS